MEDRLPLDQYLELPSRISLQDDDQDIPHASDNIIQKGSALTDPHSPMRHRKKSVTSSQPVDYVLVYKDSALDKPFVKEYRERFLTAIQNENIEAQKEIIDDFVYVKLTVAFDRLCKQATFINLEMPLKECETYDVSEAGCWKKFVKRFLQTDNEIDYVSTPFRDDVRHIFNGIENEATFFRPAQRGFLTNHILIQIDAQTVEQSQDATHTRKGLPWMLHNKIFKDSFILHDKTQRDPAEEEELAEKQAENGDNLVMNNMTPRELTMADTRKELHDTWARFRIQYQPLWKIRNYFGEKIAFYFAWSGTMITTLWIPTLIGIVVFLYGLSLSVIHRSNTNDLPENITTTAATDTSANELIDKAKIIVGSSLDTIGEAFDNDVTPFYSLVICLWGTIFLELWKRKKNTLAYEWDVASFEEMEPDRPQFYGTKTRPDPVTKQETWYYPLKKQLLKYATSSSVLIVMVIMVFISAAGVTLYRVFITVDYCTKFDGPTCLLISTVAASVLNAMSILILGKLYDKIAAILTMWENHRTQTQFDDALILKLFAFQFANSYTSLFYIAFFRKNNWPNGLFGLGDEYQDACSGRGCMSMLSLQVLVLMLMKPMPKFFKDIVYTWVRRKWRKRRWCRRSTKTGPDVLEVNLTSDLQREYLKADLGAFTLGEYTEKVIVYGFLMMFAASFPLAPLITILIGLIDMRVDAYRMLWMNRRPLAIISQDIGMWFKILRFLNIAGVVSNGFLIAFTSSWGKKYDLVGKLWIVIIFEHAVLGLSYFLDYVIPDVTTNVALKARQKKYQVGRILDEATKKLYYDKWKSDSARPSTDDQFDRTGLYGDVSNPAPPEGISEAQPRKKKKKRKHARTDPDSRSDTSLTSSSVATSLPKVAIPDDYAPSEGRALQRRSHKLPALGVSKVWGATLQPRPPSIADRTTPETVAV